jgi:hypothetical protein
MTATGPSVTLVAPCGFRAVLMAQPSFVTAKCPPCLRFGHVTVPAATTGQTRAARRLDELETPRLCPNELGWLDVCDLEQMLVLRLR